VLAAGVAPMANCSPPIRFLFRLRQSRRPFRITARDRHNGGRTVMSKLSCTMTASIGFPSFHSLRNVRATQYFLRQANGCHETPFDKIKRFQSEVKIRDLRIKEMLCGLIVAAVPGGSRPQTCVDQTISTPIFKEYPSLRNHDRSLMDDTALADHGAWQAGGG
jgi:hypothetical protein